MSEKPTETPPAPSGGKSKLLVIMMVVNMLLVGGVLVFVMKKPAASPVPSAEAATAEGAEGEHGKAAPPAPPGPGPILKLENFVIQLRTVDADRYVRVAFDVEVGTDADKAEVEKHMSHIRDSVISYFSDRTLDELRGSEAMGKTKKDLVKLMDEIVPKRVKQMYVTDFIIQ